MYPNSVQRVPIKGSLEQMIGDADRARPLKACQKPPWPGAMWRAVTAQCAGLEARPRWAVAVHAVRAEHPRHADRDEGHRRLAMGEYANLYLNVLGNSCNRMYPRARLD